jgi:hypothetical protein
MSRRGKVQRPPWRFVTNSSRHLSRGGHTKPREWNSWDAGAAVMLIQVEEPSPLPILTGCGLESPPGPDSSQSATWPCRETCAIASGYICAQRPPTPVARARLPADRIAWIPGSHFLYVPLRPVLSPARAARRVKLEFIGFCWNFLEDFGGS